MKAASEFRKRRKEFSEKTKLAVYAAQGECCRGCGDPTPRSLGRFDHIVTCFDGGANDQSNCQFICAAKCDREKTYGTKHRRLDGDAGRRAKTKRLVEKTEAFRARLADPNRHNECRPYRGVDRNKRKWPSRPFPKRKERTWT